MSDQRTESHAAFPTAGRDIASGTLRIMSVVDHVVHENERYVSTFPGPRPLQPKLRLAILACMDSRLDLFGALGLEIARWRSASARSAPAR